MRNNSNWCFLLCVFGLQVRRSIHAVRVQMISAALRLGYDHENALVKQVGVTERLCVCVWGGGGRAACF